MDAVEQFKNEIDLIENDLVKQVLIEAVKKIPEYFFFVPASSSGKYHPKSSLGVGGLIRHVKSVFYVSEELLSHPMFGEEFTSEQKDMIRAAIILHDSCKQGTHGHAEGHTRTDHPLLVRKALMPYGFTEDEELIFKDTIYSSMKRQAVLNIWDTICETIETHMGPWTKDREGKEVLYPPENPMQKHVHLCDYLASRKNIEIDIWSRTEQAGREPEPATDSQIGYIKTLVNKAQAKNIKVNDIRITDKEGKVVLTKVAASKYISKLKDLL